MKEKSRWTKFLSILITLTLIWLPSYSTYAQGADKPVTQGEFAIYLVRALGLESQLPMGANVNDYVQILESQRIVPPGGYNPSKVLTQKDMAFLMVRATGMDNRVLNKMTTKSIVKKEKATIMKITGNVKFSRGKGSGFAKAQVGDELYAEDSLKTGKNSSAELKIGQFSAALIGENTEIMIEELAQTTNKKENVRIFLKEGDILVKVKGKGRRINFETRTTTTVAGVMGTIYKMTSSKKGDETTCGEGTISTYLIDTSGKPLSEPKSLNSGQNLLADPSGKKEPVYGQADPGILGDIQKTGTALASYVKNPEPDENQPDAQEEENGSLSSYDSRKELSEGGDQALAAALEVLSEEGIVLETTGPAGAANSTITQVQITQFINDLLLSDTFDEFNVDVTPTGQ